MADRDSTFVELEKLLSTLHDGLAERADNERIEALLDGDPEACEFYIDYTQMCAAIDLELSASLPVEISAGDDVRKEIAQSTALFFEGQNTHQILNPSWRPLPWFAAAAAVAICAGTLAFFAGKWSPFGTSEAIAAEEPVAIDNGVAILMGTVGATFGEGGLQPRANGGILPLGDLRLESGIAEIEFYSGARVILEGPALFEIDSENSGVLLEGRVRAKVPQQARGFFIKTNQVEVVDLGTEFAISIDEDGHRTQVHCFEGQLETYDADSGRNPKSLRRLEASQALQFQGGKVRLIEADPMSFLSYSDMAQTSLENASMRHEQWRDLVEEMRADDDILALYNFEDQGPRERTLVNQAAYQNQFSHGAIVGCRWTSGRWPSKGALEFNRSSDRVRINAEEAFAALTLAGWVRLDALPNRNSNLLASNGNAAGATEWQITRDGKLLLNVRDENGKSVHRFPTQQPVLTGSALGKWHYLATVFDNESHSVRHYIDGREVSNSSIPNNATVSISLGDAEIGNFGGRTSNGKRPVRNLTGRIDEFAMFRRALNADELAEMYRIGRPN
jgi:hypothetical protein